ncbi:hypothetical protein DPMN_117850 [Dreissena polymorpha]|uniref:Uncharacterized protein n=1 Tax=Dreissena polymorpha TaxID=45954 RepID=A0A9D4JL53_DREPO|nr:hypothetical protein DPMN_117850 [Dreissena polymorpha]
MSKNQEDSSGNFSNSLTVEQSLLSREVEKALEKQRDLMLDQFSVRFGNKSNNNRNQDFQFKKEGLKYQFNFNMERVDILKKIERLCDLQDVEQATSLIRSEAQALQQRNKLLKITDKHGWDTVREYDEHPLADKDDDAAKLRSAIARAKQNRRFRPNDVSSRSKDYGASSIRSSSQFFRGPSARFGEVASRRY